MPSKAHINFFNLNSVVLPVTSKLDEPEVRRVDLLDPATTFRAIRYSPLHHVRPTEGSDAG